MGLFFYLTLFLVGHYNLTLISRLSFSLLGHVLVLKFLEIRAFLFNPFSTVFGVSARKLPFSIM